MLKLLCIRKLVTMQLMLQHEIWLLGFTNNEVTVLAMINIYVCLYHLGCTGGSIVLCNALFASSSALRDSNKFRIIFT